MMRDKRKCASADERQWAIYRMGDLIEGTSELLWASIVWGEGYPELCEMLDRMAEEMAQEIRVLGRWMLRRGIDPPISRLCLSARRRETSVDGVIRSLLEKEEAALRSRRGEGCEGFSSARAEERVRRLRRLLS